MLLAIDVGNTETVVGLFADDPAAPLGATGPRDGNEPTGLAHHWRLSTVAERTADEHALLLTQLLDLDGLDIDDTVSGHRRDLVGARWSPPTSARWWPGGSTCPPWCWSRA